MSNLAVVALCVTRAAGSDRLAFATQSGACANCCQICIRSSYRAPQYIDCTSTKTKASTVIHEMPSTHMSAGRLRAAARHAARYLQAEPNAAVNSRNAVPMDVGRIASSVSSTSQVSIGTAFPPSSLCFASGSTSPREHSCNRPAGYC